MHFLTPEELKARKARNRMIMSGFTVVGLILLFTIVTVITYQL
ncbi:hypothetical protein ACOJQI_21610 [Bacillus salacetis]